MTKQNEIEILDNGVIRRIKDGQAIYYVPIKMGVGMTLEQRVADLEKRFAELDEAGKAHAAYSIRVNEVVTNAIRTLSSVNSNRHDI